MPRSGHHGGGRARGAVSHIKRTVLLDVPTCLQAAAGSNIKYFKVYRWDPEVEGQKPYVATYALNLDE